MLLPVKIEVIIIIKCFQRSSIRTSLVADETRWNLANDLWRLAIFVMQKSQPLIIQHLTFVFCLFVLLFLLLLLLFLSFFFFYIYKVQIG